MATTLHVALYAGAVVTPNEVVIRAQGVNGSPAGGILRFVDAYGYTHPIAKSLTDEWGVTEWVVNFDDGPELGHAPWRGPTEPPSRFHFSLEARAVNPVTDKEEPVLVVVRDDDGPIRAKNPDTGEPIDDDEIEIAGTLQLYLEA